MIPIRLAVLDMAGTTVREDGVVEEAFLGALADLGAAPGQDAGERFRRSRGGSKLRLFQEALDGDLDLARRAHDAFRDRLLEGIRRGRVVPLPGAEETMLRLHEMGVQVALVTGFSADVRDALLRRLRWEELADLALSPEDAGRGRPHPDLVLAALLRLRLEDVREVAVAGDTVNDLLAGTRAGASIVAGVLTGAHSRQELEQAPHTHLLAEVGELPDVVAGAPSRYPRTQ